MSEYTMKLPDVGEGVAEAEIVEWHVEVGERIDADDAIVEVMSDKASVELSSPVGGTVTWLAGEPGDMLAVGSDLMRLDVDGEVGREVDDEVDDEVGGGVGDDVDGDVDGETEPTAIRPAAAPAVRARARDLGIDLDDVVGTGPDARVLHRDLDALLTATPTRAPRVALRESDGDDSDGTDDGDDVDEVAVVGLRRTIAEHMQRSARSIAHFTYVEEVDVTALERLREELNAEHPERIRLSLLPFVMRAVVIAVRTHSEMNAHFDDTAGVVRRHRAVHLGVATRTERGLMVPVVEHAERLGLWDSAGEVARLAEAARAATITVDELGGSTITVTSLGALGGIVSTPIVNAPEVAIVGVNRIAERATVIEGTIVVRKMMNLSSSFDHRVIDGADAAAFIQSIRRLLESPARMFIDER